MSPFFQLNVVESPPAIEPKQEGEVTVAIIIGGSHSASGDSQSTEEVDLVIDVDVPDALEKRSKQFASLPQRVPYAVGQGHTAHSLVRWGSRELQDAIQDVGAMFAEQGLGAMAATGYLAFLEAMSHPAHRELVTRLSRMMSSRTGGRARRLLARAMLGACGGTGGSHAVGFCRSLVGEVAPRVVTHIEYDVISSEAFADCGPRVYENAAAAQYRLIRAIRSRCKELPLLVETLRLLNHIPFGTDNRLLDSRVSLDEQCIHAAARKAHRATVRPNNALDQGRYGFIEMEQMDVWRPLDQVKDVTQQIAESYREVLDQAIQRSAAIPSRVPRIEVAYNETSQPRDTVENIIGGELSLDDQFEELRRSSVIDTPTLTAWTDKNNEFRLRYLYQHFDSPPQSLTAYCDELQLLQSIGKRVATQLQHLQEESAKAKVELDTLEQAFKNNDDESMITSAFRTLRLLPSSEDAWTQQAERIREVADEQIRTDVQIKAYEEAQSGLTRLTASRASVLEKLRKTLDKHCPRGREGRQTSLISAQHPDHVFQKLVDLPSLSHEEQVGKLSRLVGGVSLEGLAKILGCDASVDAIVDTVVTGRNIVEGPQLGGHVRPRHGDVIFVFPPMPCSLWTAISAGIRARDNKTVVAMSPSAAVGCTVTRYTVTTPKTLREAFPGRLWNDLKTAYASPRRILYFPDGIDELEQDLATGDAEFANEQLSAVSLEGAK